MAEISISGEWWLPSSPERRVPGEVTYSTETGSRLVTNGSLLQSESDQQNLLMAEERWSDTRDNKIYGLSHDGDRITLVRPLLTGRERSTFPHREEDSVQISEKYESVTMFSGIHIEDIQGIDNLRFEFRGIDKVTNVKLIEHLLTQEGAENKGLDLGEFSSGILYNEGVERVAVIDDMTVSLKTRTSAQVETLKSEVKQKTFLRLDFENEMSFSRIDAEYLRPLQHYFSMALGTPVNPINVTTSGTTIYQRNIDIYHTYSSQVDQEDPTIWSFWVEEIDFQESLENWFKHAQSAHTLHRNYFSSQYEFDMPIEFRFLSLVVGLESYYESVVAQPHLIPSDEFHEEYLDEMLEILPDNSEIQTRVENLLSSVGHYPSLRTQLEEVVNPNRSLLIDLIDVDTVLGDMVSLRHQIAHGLAPPDRSDLYDLFPKICAIVEAILYQEMCLEDEEVTSLINEKHSFTR